MAEVPVRKNALEGPVPSVWRPTLDAIVLRFVHGDYSLNSPVPGIAPVSGETSREIKTNIRSYGATLVPLKAETWGSSVSIWQGNHWQVLVDLVTEEEGVSDLALSAKVGEVSCGYQFEVYLVYVP